MNIAPEQIIQVGDDTFQIADIRITENAEVIITANRVDPAVHGGEGAGVSEARVKPLEWTQTGSYLRARSAGVEYEILDSTPAWERPFQLIIRFLSTEKVKFYVTLDEAKAAAQADFDKRILSCLTATQSAPAPGGWRDIPADDALVSYLLRYGGRCRDCADNFGTCEHSGLPCEVDPARKAIRHVISAINYGMRHGYLSAPPAPEPVADAVVEALVKDGSPLIQDLIRETERAIRQRDEYMRTGVSTASHGGSHDTCFGVILAKHLVPLAQPAPAAQEAPSGVVEPRSIYESVLACPHVIEHEAITLKYDRKQSGHNALSQLAARTRLALADHIAAALAERQPQPQEGWQPTHRHKKRGSEYMLLGVGKMQAGTWIDPIPPHGLGHPRVDMAEVVIYRSKDGDLWVRPRGEFDDGRFEAFPSQEGE